ncbi:hypothetical protein [Pendulispora albinea]|uniref:Uncharacterized protein n=1 Tax=Pendulispora albinea TaxID=2741071 RepID=A0ABZ2LMA3_9BACT
MDNPTMHPLRSLAVSILLASAVTCCQRTPPAKTSAADAAKAAGAKTEAAPVRDPMTALNQTARGAYRTAKERILRGLGPTMVVEGDKLVFLHDGQREEAVIHPRAYHELKTLDHVPLALDALIGDSDGPVDLGRLTAMRELRAHIAPAEQAFLAHGHPAASVERQKRILASSVALMDDVLDRRTLAHAAYVQFARATAPLLLASVDEAARMELDAIHANVSRWRAAMPASAWSRLRVVVISSHMARDQSLQMQYFQRLLGEPGEGRRIVFAEGLWEESKALDLEATHILDARLAESFFGDATRMHRDLLADAAAAYLPKLLPAAP